MNGPFWRGLPILCVCLYTCGLAIFLAVTNYSNPAAENTVWVIIAYITVSLMGTAVMGVLRGQERRIQNLERQLRERDDRA
jgi:hypothetical protein